MPSLPLLKALGLNFSPNQLEVQPGSLVEASNIIIRRDDVIESRRGYALYGTAMGSSSDRCKQLLSYKNKIIRHFLNRLQYENGLNNAGVASFFDFNEIVNGVSSPATIEEAESGLRLKSVEANSNLYFTTSEGIKKISVKSAEAFAAATITQAGGIKALDAEAILNTTIGDQTSFLPADAGVAYKIVWGTKDANGNLILGTPSDPVTVLNPLLDLTLKDFSNLLLQIDNAANTGNSLFPSPSNYYSTLALPLTATSVELRDNLILLAKKLDEELLFATDTGLGTIYEPLDISGATVSSGVVTVNFAIPGGGILPSAYFIAGDKEYNVNIPYDATTSTFGFTSNGVGVDNINTNQIVTTVGASSVSFVAKNYSTTNPAGISGNITNVPANSTAGSQDITITAPNHGLKNGQKITISGTTSGPLINATHTITYLTPDSFSVTVTVTPPAPPGNVVAASNQGVWDVVVDGFTTAKIESYTFRNIELPSEQTIPATNNQLVSVRDYYSEILLALQDFIAARGSNIVNSTVYSTYLQSLDASSNASVTLKITIPPAVLEYTASSNPYFYQIYRTDIAYSEGVSTISDIAIIQEYTQIEEKFPTSSELSDGVVVFLDNTPESIAGTGANLYTNERTGEGGLQANDVPPFALDINQFKGYTFFSNTYTRQRKTITLIGVVNMINSFNPSNPYKLTISNGITENTYQFVTGLSEITELTCGAASAVANSGTSNYFTLNSANDQTEYYVWFQKGTSTDPAIANKTGIGVVLETTDTPSIVANKTTNAISNVLDSFSAVVFNSVVTVSASALTDTFTASLHGFSDGDIVQLVSTGELPFGLNNNNYYVVNAALNSFQLSLTSGGNAVDFTTDGSPTIKAYRLSASGSGVLIKTADSGASSNAAFPGLPPVGFSIATTQEGRGENVSAKQVLLSSNPSVGIAIEETAKSLIKVINQNPFEFVNAFYISGTETTPGTILIESRGLDTDEFYLMGSNSTIGESFNPDLSPGTTPITAISATNPTVISTLNNNFLPTAVDILTNIITINNHGFSENFQIVFTSSGTVPSPLVSGTKYYVKNSTLNTFQVALVAGGAAIDLTTSGTGSLNAAVPHNLLNGDSIVVSNSNSTPSIDGVYQITYVSANQFTIPVNVTIAGTSAVFESIGVAEGSSNEEQPHRVYYSKFQQPEAVPILNYLDIGATDKQILRIFPLRDSLFVFKEDGLFRISGEVTPFTVALFDSSCILTAPDSLAVSNNQLYGWTTQGISTITEAGVNIISRPIDTEILRKASNQFTNFKTATWGIGYESDNSYTVYTVSEPSDTEATIGFRYSNLTNSWTTVDKSCTAGLVNPADDKLYLGAGDVNFLEKERKEFTRYDYADRELAFNLVSGAISGSTIALPIVSNLGIGDVVVQDQTLTTYEFNALLQKLDIDPGVPSSDYYPTLKAIAGNDMRSKIESLALKLDVISGTVLTAFSGNPAVITTSAPHGLQTGQQVTISGNSQSVINQRFEVTVTGLTSFTIPLNLMVSGVGGSFATELTPGYGAAIASLSGGVATASIANPTKITTTAPHGLKTGRYVTVSGNTRDEVNGTFQVTVLSFTEFTIPVDLLVLGTGGTFVTLDDGFNDLKTCYNLVISKLNSDPKVAYSNYRPVDNNTIQEAIIQSIDLVAKTITLNIVLDYVVGSITVFKAIPCSFTYSPLTMGDPLGLKHIREATMMFANKAFTSAELTFSTDLLPEVLNVSFNGDGNGIFGHQSFGSGFFGGASNAAPFRTFIPRQCQRCRYINVGFSHRTAREQYAIYGITLTGEVGQSTRAYR